MSLSKARQLAQDLGTVGISSGGTSVATTVANIVTGESMLTVDDSVTVTVEEGKTVVPDLFDVFS